MLLVRLKVVFPAFLNELLSFSFEVCLDGNTPFRFVVASVCGISVAV
jgi:hypothetical protein